MEKYWKIEAKSRSTDYLQGYVEARSGRPGVISRGLAIFLSEPERLRVYERELSAREGTLWQDYQGEKVIEE